MNVIFYLWSYIVKYGYCKKRKAINNEKIVNRFGEFYFSF